MMTTIKTFAVSDLAPHPFQEYAPTFGGEAFEHFKADINENGVTHLLIVSERTGSPVVIDGNHRVRAASELGLESLSAEVKPFKSEAEEILLLASSNAHRKDKPVPQMVRMGLALAEYFKPLAKEAQLNGLKQNQTTVNPDLGERLAINTNAKTAEAIGLSKTLYEYGKALYEQAPPDILEPWLQGKNSTDAAHKQLRARQKEQERLEAERRAQEEAAKQEAQQAAEAQPEPPTERSKPKEKLKDEPPNPEPQEPKPTVKLKAYITLDEWNSGVREAAPSQSSMNVTNDNIEWAALSWNPITGCRHECPYCYARDIAERFYKQQFEPSFLPGRLSSPANTKPLKPRWENDTGNRNVFTCSMADLFGKWVPAEWIQAVIDTCRDNPQWTFLFLTKFPIRMSEFDYPANIWLGTTVDRQGAVARAERAFTKIKASGFEGVCWLSCEPMLERLTFGSLSMFDWVVMGGASRSSQTPEYLPPFEDIVHLHLQAREAGCMVYQKTNLIPGMRDAQRLREYPT